jgi:hypothetical protein
VQTMQLRRKRLMRVMFRACIQRMRVLECAHVGVPFIYVSALIPNKHGPDDAEIVGVNLRHVQQ